VSASLLVELLTEELPPKALRGLGYAFANALLEDLQQDGFAPKDPPSTTVYATPRRLGVLVRDVAEKAPDHEVTIKGPSVKVGLGADGTPSQALVMFAKKRGVPVERLERILDGKQEVFVSRELAAGGLLETNLDLKVADALRKASNSLRAMRWGDHDEAFVRPVHALVMLHGDRVVPGKVLGQESGRATRGHRFMGRGAIVLHRADDYEASLERDGKVIANFGLRARKIREALVQAAGGASIAADEALYDEVTALVEWPAVYEGHFDKAFLEVPQECLMLTMKQNQKYFPLVDGRGKLLNRFLIVSNVAVPHPHHIVHGNERVLRARLADAKFFYDQDRRVPLESRVPALAGVVFHNRLGSQFDRVQRIERLAAVIAGKLGAEERLARRAARLCKADLLTGMVGEFPELQGIMGMYYARHDGEPETVAAAIEAHYHPRFAGDSLPEEPVGACVALADKLDTLVGIWGIGLQPTGDKDPFGLRRAALGVVRILVERELALDLAELLRDAHAAYAGREVRDAAGELHSFILERLRSSLRDRDYAPDEIDAVLAAAPTRLDLVVPRLEAVRAFRRLPEAESLAAANKRIRNILRKSEQVEQALADSRLFREEAERELHRAIARIRSDVEGKAAAREYTESLRLLAQVRPQVDKFFDEVLVNAEDAALRRNRLRLLGELEHILNQVADISKLAARAGDGERPTGNR
jgi:glycyl-tRNA synthetase beta chain